MAVLCLPKPIQQLNFIHRNIHKVKQKSALWRASVLKVILFPHMTDEAGTQEAGMYRKS